MASPYYKFGAQQHFVYDWQHRAPSGSRAAETRALGAMESPLDRSLQIGSGIGQGAQIFTPDLRAELGADRYVEAYREGAQHYSPLSVPVSDWPPAYGYGNPEPVGGWLDPYLAQAKVKLESDKVKKVILAGAAGLGAWYLFFRKPKRKRRRR